MKKALLIVSIFPLLSLISYSQTGSSPDGDCPIPTGETSTWRFWEFSTIGKWRGTLTPTNVSFEGSSVTERDGGQGNDWCWFQGSRYPKVVSLTGGTWPVNPGNIWEYDKVGQGPTRVTYYREWNTTCEVTRLQKMDIICPSGSNVEYKANWLIFGLTATTVFSERDGIRTTRNWP